MKKISLLKIFLFLLLSFCILNGNVKADTVINSVTLNGGDIPRAGSPPSTSWTVPAGANYYYSSQPYFIEKSSSNRITSEDKFENGKIYLLVVNFKPKEGYCFPESVYALKPTLNNISSSDYSIQSINPSGGGTYPNRTVYFVFNVTQEADTYTVSFDLNGGTGTMNPVTVNKNEEYTIPDCTATAPSGKEFSRWICDDSSQINPGDKITVTSNVILKAQWRDSTQGKTAINTISLSGGKLPKAGETPSYSWNVDSSSNYSITGSIIWKDKATYNNLSATDTFQEGKRYLLIVTFKPNDGYYFLNNDKLTAKLKNYDSSSYSINQINEAGGGTYPNRTVYYEFIVQSDIVYRNVCFYTQNELGKKLLMKSVDVINGQNVEAPRPGPTLTGFSFDGWRTENGIKVTLPKPIYSYTELYAGWIKYAGYVNYSRQSTITEKVDGNTNLAEYIQGKKDEFEEEILDYSQYYHTFSCDSYLNLFSSDENNCYYARKVGDEVTNVENTQIDTLKRQNTETTTVYYELVKVSKNSVTPPTPPVYDGKGDLDRNGVVDANDASVALELYKAQNATTEDVSIGDMDSNNLIDANDASLILEYYKTHQ